MRLIKSSDPRSFCASHPSALVPGDTPRTHHTLVEAVVLLLEAGDGQSALVSLVTLLRQRQPPLPPPADGGGGGPGGPG